MCYPIHPETLKDKFKDNPPLGNPKLSYEDKYMARRAYHYELKHFTVGLEVELLPLPDVIRQFTTTKRTDIDIEAILGSYGRTEVRTGVIRAQHPVNGVMVELHKNFIWLEPECLCTPSEQAKAKLKINQN